MLVHKLFGYCNSTCFCCQDNGDFIDGLAHTLPIIELLGRTILIELISQTLPCNFLGFLEDPLFFGGSIDVQCIVMFIGEFAFPIDSSTHFCMSNLCGLAKFRKC